MLSCHSPREVHVEVIELRHVVHEDSQLILGDSVHRLYRFEPGPAFALRREGSVGDRRSGVE